MEQDNKTSHEETLRRSRGAGATPPAPDFRAVFESLPGLYLVLDPDLRIVAVSDAYAKATMTKREEILGCGIFEVFPDNPADPQATGVRNLKSSLLRVRRDLTADTMPVQKYDIRKPERAGRDFEERYWSPINAPVFGPDRQLAYIIHRVEDVTEFIRQKEKGDLQEKVTEELRQEEERMQAELYARNREIAGMNLKLQQANDELGRLYEQTKELDRVKTQFFANMSHELRTPLTLILGPVEQLLKSDGIEDLQRRDLEVVRRNAKLLLHHVNDLLDVAKLEAGHMVLRCTEIDLAGLVRLVGFAFESLAAERQIGYAVDAVQTVKCRVDPAKVRRILLNLLSNAIKFTPPGGRIALTLRTEDDRAVISIEDSGPGIPAHLRERIFERFWQGETIAHGHPEGTGLGLAIVKEFVMLHGGAIAVEDAPGGGALFRVTLPLVAPAAADTLDVHPEPAGFFEDAGERVVEDFLSLQAGTATPEQSPPTSALPPDAPLVLVVDDNPDMRIFEAGILGRKYRIISAADGAEGLQKALVNIPDLIVSDIMMPRMNGEQMVHELRRRPELADTPIIVITAKSREEFIVRMLQAGIQGYLVKPFSAEELMARAEGLIAEKKRKEELQQLVYAISHDLQEPLRTIINFLQLLAERYKGRLDQDADRYIAYVVEGANRMYLLIDDLLTYARIGTGQKPFTPVPMNKVFEQAIQGLRATMTASDTEITRDDLPEVFGEAGQLLLLLQNLIGNAIKFGKRGVPPRIHLSVEGKGMGLRGARQRHRHRARVP